MFRRHKVFFILLACSLVLPLQAAERILSFHSDIKIAVDSTMQVTETIRVRAEGNQIKRGIYREFPTDYRDRLNNRIQVGFEVLNVTRDGRNEAFFTERYSNGVRVYIGSKHFYLPDGEYEYAITYQTTRQLGYFENHDELYWNVTGNGWGFAIEEASATVSLPAGVERSAMSLEGYTGPKGSRDQDYEAFIDSSGKAFITITQRLRVNEGLTLVLSWPKGVVIEPGRMARLGFLLDDNRALFLALCGLGLMAGYLFMVWSRYGRDPAAGPIFPHYVPPESLSPGACRYIQKMSHDNQCFSAAVLNLAVKGYITIHEGGWRDLMAATGEDPREVTIETIQAELEKRSDLEKKLLGPLLKHAKKALESIDDDETFLLEKNELAAGASLPELAPGEQALLKALFKDDNYLELQNSNHRVISKAINAHEKALKKYYQAINFFTNGKRIFPAILLGGAFFIYAFMTAEITPLVIMVMVLTVPLIGLFSYLLKAPTLRGRKVMDRIEGFKMYLMVAEAEDLQRIEGIAGASPTQTPELFEQYLPFAIALDVEQLWADQFESLLAKISLEQGGSYRPGWYNGSRRVSSFSGFTTGLTGALGTAISSSSTAPGSSSGGGGGGSSGGGGGGGGGGGW
jgi:uncharacterized membrane protein YgcG